MLHKFIIGIDLGGTNLKLALLDAQYRILDRAVLSTRNFKSRLSLIRIIIASIKKIISDNRLRKQDILGVGLGLPGPIDVKNGRVHFFPNIPGWKKVCLSSILKKRLKIPVFLDNDANLMALAEHRLGAGRGMRNLLCLTLGTGVGGGIILEGRLYRGSSYAAGEIGHLPINEKGPRCNCGGFACLESYIGNKRILSEARKVFKKSISLEELSSLARQGNNRALKIWTKVAWQLGVALSGLVNIFNPDGIIIGGGVANAGKFFFNIIYKTIVKRAMSVQAKCVSIRKAKLGNDAGMIGAAILVKERLE